MIDNSFILYVTIYILIVIYFAILSTFMLTRQGNLISTHGEMMAKRRMMHSVGLYMLVCTLDWIIYLPVILIDNPALSCYINNFCFIITTMVEIPMLYYVMHAVLQKQVNNLLWTCVSGSPFLLVLIAYLVMPQDTCGRMSIHLSAALAVAFIIHLVCRYINEYRNYIRRIKSEYSDISGREIIWSWSCFSGFALQMIIFIIYVYYQWLPFLEYVYAVLTICNTTYLCYCTCRQKPIDINVVEDLTDDPTLTLPSREETIITPQDIQPSSPPEEGLSGGTGVKTKAVSTIIEQKLKSLCEDKYLYLEPDLTRETLCHRLGISSTYLKMYFHSRNLSFYQYINTLRVEYAHKLMQENPGISIRDVSEQSGFRSQTTFRKMFKEVMGCLPSDIKQKGPKGT